MSNKKDNKKKTIDYALVISIIALIPLLLEAFNVINILPTNYEELSVGILTTLVLSGVVVKSKKTIEDKEKEKEKTERIEEEVEDLKEDIEKDIELSKVSIIKEELKDEKE